MQNGAQEIDTVLVIGQLKSANYPAVYADIAATVAAAAAAHHHQRLSRSSWGRRC